MNSKECIHFESANQLRELMLQELDNLKNLILNNPDKKFNALSEEEKKEYNRFISYYSTCPICGQRNHFSNLKNFFFDEEKQSLRKKLIRLMNYRNPFKKFNINFGIPCCDCYKKINSE